MDFREELKKRFPAQGKLQDGTEVTVRPLKTTDETALGEFFQRMPVEERHLFKDDVTDAKVIKRWCAEADYDRILPLLAVKDDRIVCDTTLHKSSIRASRHVAQIKVSVDPDFRGRGLARLLIGHLLDLAPKAGICYVDAEVLVVQKRALALFEELEFMTVGTLPQHARDLTDKFHDVVLMTTMVLQPDTLSPDADLREGDVDIGGQG